MVEGSLRISFLSVSIISIFIHREKSFQSLYSLLRGRRCAYFYYVSPTFTVLFLSEGMSATGQLEAVLNKSTRGLRKALEKEGWLSVTQLPFYFCLTQLLKPQLHYLFLLAPLWMLQSRKLGKSDHY